jgi:hypothetical protein
LPVGRRYRRRRFLIGGATMLLIGGAAYKLGQNSVKQVEEEEITNADMAAIEAEAVDASDPSQPAEPDYIAELEKLADLVDKGIITQEEFEAKKKSLLGL